MEKTIKDDLNRKIVYQRMLNDNSLLEYYAKNGMFYITIRFIEQSSIREHVLKILSEDEMNDIFQIINFNEDDTAIAIFDKTDDGYQLSSVYDVEEHSCEVSDFMDIAYEKKFKKALNKQLIKKE